MRRALGACGLALLLALGASGCYRDGYYDDTEIIRFQNHTSFLVDNYIDGTFVGTAPRNGNLELEGNYEGLHTFESFAEDDVLHWGPRDIRVRDGDLIILDLVRDGSLKVQQESSKGASR